MERPIVEKFEETNGLESSLVSSDVDDEQLKPYIEELDEATEPDEVAGFSGNDDRQQHSIPFDEDDKDCKDVLFEENKECKDIPFDEEVQDFPDIPFDEKGVH